MAGAADRVEAPAAASVGPFRGVELTEHPDERAPFGERADEIDKGNTVVDEVAVTAYDRGTYVANMIRR